MMNAILWIAITVTAICAAIYGFFWWLRKTK